MLWSFVYLFWYNKALHVFISYDFCEKINESINLKINHLEKYLNKNQFWNLVFMNL